MDNNEFDNNDSFLSDGQLKEEEEEDMNFSVVSDVQIQGKNVVLELDLPTYYNVQSFKNLIQQPDSNYQTLESTDDSIKVLYQEIQEEQSQKLKFIPKTITETVQIKKLPYDPFNLSASCLKVQNPIQIAIRYFNDFLKSNPAIGNNSRQIAKSKESSSARNLYPNHSEEIHRSHSSSLTPPQPTLRLTRIMQELDKNKDGSLEVPTLTFNTEGGLCGTHKDCKYKLTDKLNRISRFHFLILYDNSRFYLQDNKSTNGLGIKLTKEGALLQEQSLVEIGAYELQVQSFKKAGDVYQLNLQIRKPLVKANNGIYKNVQMDLQEGNQYIIGWSSSCKIQLEKDNQVDEYHSKIYVNKGGFYISDLGSVGGVWLKLSQIKSGKEERVVINNQDVIKVVPFYFQVTVN